MDISVVRADVSKADEIRLAYLINFARYITWPTTIERNQFEFCVLEDNVLADRLKNATEGKEIDEKKFVVNLIKTTQVPNSIETLKDCAVIYFPSSLKNNTLDRYLQSAKQTPNLRVGDDAQFLDKGGDIRFVIIDGTVRFEINLDNVRKSGLDMSSRLLKHAEHVIEENRKKGGAL